MIKTHDLCFALSQTLGKDGVEVRRSRMVVPFADTVLYLWVPQAPRFLLAHVVILILVVVISLSGFLLVSFLFFFIVHVYVCVYIYIHMQMRLCLSVCMYACTYLYIHTVHEFVCDTIHAYVYIYSQHIPVFVGVVLPASWSI